MNKLLISAAILITITITVLSSCSTIPKNVAAVKPFDGNKYLGKWYEIARLDFRFEKNLNNTTANYSYNPDGSIKVVNRGYNYKTNKWKQSVGKAKFVAGKNEGKLKVSFFGPFYGGYNVIAIDSAYTYALVLGSNKEYLWFLSRKKTIPDSVKQDYLKKAQDYSCNIAKLVWVEHDKE